MAILSILTPKEAKYVKAINSAPFCHFLDTNLDDAIQYVSVLLRMPKSEESNDTFWFLTPPEPSDETQRTPIQKPIHQELITLQKLEQLSHQDKQKSRKYFLSQFHWTDSTLNTEARKAFEELPVESQAIFARQRFDIGINDDLKVKLTHFDEIPAYSQNLPTPINLKEAITVELALLH